MKKLIATKDQELKNHHSLTVPRVCFSKIIILSLCSLLFCHCDDNKTDDSYFDCEAGVNTYIAFNFKLLDKYSIDVFFENDSLELADVKVINTDGFLSPVSATIIEEDDLQFLQFTAGPYLYRGDSPSFFDIEILDEKKFSFNAFYIHDSTFNGGDCYQRFLVSEVYSIDDQESKLICSNCNELPYIELVIE